MTADRRPRPQGVAGVSGRFEHAIENDKVELDSGSERCPMLKRALRIAVLALFLVPATLAAQDDASVTLCGVAGSQGAPSSFDFARTVDYSTGFHYGGALRLGFTDVLSLRAGALFASTTGDEATGGGAVTGEVDFDRRYYSMVGRLALPTASPFEPYAVGGGGLVQIRRRHPDYSYDVDQVAGIFGAGVSYEPDESRLVFRVEGTGRVYPRHGDNATQLDPVFNVGIGYTIHRP